MLTSKQIQKVRRMMNQTDMTGVTERRQGPRPVVEKLIAEHKRMREALRRIACDYKTPDQIRKTSEQELGLSGDEALEMAYENIRVEASEAVKGIRAFKN